MISVHGYVKVKETNEPIAGLVVSIYTDGVQPAIKGETKISNPFEYYTKSLGSTFTNELGEFRIELGEQSAIHYSKKAEDLKLILAVLAPTTPEAINRLSATPPYKRLLYWDDLPSMGDGQSEARVIWLFAEQLRLHGIKLQQDKIDMVKRAEQFVKAEEDSIRFQKALTKGIAPIRIEQFKRKREIRDKGKRFVAQLYATPKAVRSQSNFITKKEEVEQVMITAMKKGLENIKEAVDQNNIYVNSVVMTLGNDDFAAAGLDFPLGIGRLELDPRQLCQLLHRRQGGTELVRVRKLLDALKEGSSALGDGDGETSPGETSGEVTPIEDQTDDSLAIRRRVLGQLKDMPLERIELDGNLPQRLTPEELNAMLPAVRLGAGPSDVPSFHDFYHLQIAFPYIWTEAFDKSLRNDVMQLYNSIVKYHEDYLSSVRVEGYEFPLPAEVQEIDDLESLFEELALTVEDVPGSVAAWFNLTWDIWKNLSFAQRNALLGIADHLNVKWDELAHWYELGIDWQDYQRIWDEFTALKEYGNTIIGSGENAESHDGRIFRLLDQIRSRLSEPYAFHYFAPDSVNFGLMLNYRQHWQPGLYQVGDLVSAIPLAPGEKRKYETKKVIKRTRSENELEKSLMSKSREVSGTSRAESEIVEKATLNSNFKMTAEGTFRIGIANIKSSSEFAINSAQESSRVRKDFHEAVMKAAQEYKQERSVQVQTTSEITYETTTSGELSNPNNELTVTYLLYELERQYKISESIHRVTPVILVAQDIPAPNEITESWLLAHEWILHRVLLDDTLRPALDYVSDAFAGEEVSISIHKATWESQVLMVKDLEAAVKGLKSNRDVLRKGLIEAQQEVDLLERMEEDVKAARIMRGIFTFGLSEATPNPAQLFADMTLNEAIALQKATEERLKYAEEALVETQERFISAQEALAKAKDEYTGAIKSQTDRRVAIDQLRIHVKENILYYMQAIFDHEPPDQRFFRLYSVQVPLPESIGTIIIRPATEEEIEMGMPTVRENGRHYIVQLDPPGLADPNNPTKKPLVEIADIDHPLGYKGNYIIFPLKTCLYLTNFMMCQFFDDYFGVRDPDLAANFSVDELQTYTEELLKDPTVKEDQRAALQSIVMTKLRHPNRDSDLVVVPTGELYMEALLGEHVLLENFKLNHRFFDMAKARAEWREAELENLRRAARLLQEEPNLEDPDVDKRIVVEGDANVHVDTP